MLGAYARLYTGYDTLVVVATFSPFWAGKFRHRGQNRVRYCSPLTRHLLDQTKQNYKGEGPKNEEPAGDEILGGKTKFRPARDVAREHVSPARDVHVSGRHGDRNELPVNTCHP